MGQFFHNDDLTGLAHEQVGPIDYNWGSGSPAAWIDGDTFSARWIGQLEANHSESHTFYTTSNQGVRLWIDGRLLIDNWTPHNTEVDAATIDLEAGQRYDVRLDFYEQAGSARIELEWESESTLRQVVPADSLYESPPGLLGTYTDAFGGSAERVDAVVDFDWELGRPVAGIAVDRFNVAWTGQVVPDHSERYDFSVVSDEGVRLWIGGELVIDDWDRELNGESVGSIELEAGKWTDIRLEYRDEAGPSSVLLRWASPSQTVDAAPEAVPSANLRASKPTPVEFTNVLGAGQDPYVTRIGGSYLSTRVAGRTVFIERAESLQDIHPTNPGSSTAVAWTAPLGTAYSEQIWAPEIHHIDGKWYIYVTASDGNNATHRMYVLERDDPDPMGSYVFRGQLTTNPDRWAIDGTVLQHEGELYFVWSGWPGPTNGIQNLYIAPMSDPLTISGPSVMISTPQFAWEQFGLAINEGPQVLRSGDRLHLMYSASGYWREEYALGLLTHDGVGSLLDPSSWSKSPTPVFQRDGDVVGTGHGSATTSPDGIENWLVFHAHREAGNFQEDREVYLQEFEFDESGDPVFGTPLPKGTPLAEPSGTPQPRREVVPGDFDASGSIDTDDYDVWRSSFGVATVPGISADANGSGHVDAADYTVWRDGLEAAANPTPTRAYWRHEAGEVGQTVSASSGAVDDASGNGNTVSADSAIAAATYTSSVSPLPLKSGLSNTVALDFGPGGDGLGRNDANATDNVSIESESFSELTVELAFRMESIGGFQALVGKDGMPVASPVPPFKVVVRGDDFPNSIPNQLFVEWVDGSGDIHFLASGSTTPVGEWLHVAFVLRESSAELYVAGEAGTYTLVDSLSGIQFVGAGGQVLIDSVGAFTIGRGAFNNSPADWADALIDEVRISNSALSPNDFLFDTAVVALVSSTPPAPASTGQSLAIGAWTKAPLASVGSDQRAAKFGPHAEPVASSEATEQAFALLLAAENRSRLEKTDPPAATPDEPERSQTAGESDAAFEELWRLLATRTERS